MREAPARGAPALYHMLFADSKRESDHAQSGSYVRARRAIGSRSG